MRLHPVVHPSVKCSIMFPTLFLRWQSRATVQFVNRVRRLDVVSCWVPCTMLLCRHICIVPTIWLLLLNPLAIHKFVTNCLGHGSQFEHSKSSHVRKLSLSAFLDSFQSVSSSDSSWTWSLVFTGSISSTVSADPILAPFHKFNFFELKSHGIADRLVHIFLDSPIGVIQALHLSLVCLRLGAPLPCDTDRSLVSPGHTTQVVPFFQFVLQTLAMLHSHQIEPFLVDQCSTLLQETHCRSACDAQLHERTSNI